MTDKPQYTGRMIRDPATGEISMWIEDAWGWRISIRATKDADGYALTGSLGETPAALRFPVLDDPA